MAEVFLIDRNEALDALDEALEPGPEMWDCIRTALRALPFVQAAESSSPTLVDAAIAIKAYCDSRKGCDGCCFHRTDVSGEKTCCVGCPENWSVSREDKHIISNCVAKEKGME